jgi:hypothetical protein
VSIHHTRGKKASAFFMVLLGFVVTGAAAPEDVALYPSDSWVWRFAPMFGPQKYEGTVRVESERGDVSASLSDVAKKATFQMAMQLEGHKEQAGILIDLSYIDLNADFNNETQATSLSADLLSVDTLVSYGIGPWLIGSGSAGFEVLGGGRWNQFNADVQVYPGGSANAGRGWVDPVVGGRVTANFDFPLRLEARSDWGGFGVGSATELTWRFFGAAHYRPDPALDFFAGYRITDIESQHQSGTSGTALDGRISGPVIGITFILE